MSTEGGTSGLNIGPVQMLVIGFENGKFEGKILEELKRLRENDIIRLVDLMFVTKSDDGDLVSVQASDLSHEEAVEFGALVGALIGFGYGDEESAERAAVAGAQEMEDGHFFDEDEVWYVGDAIPPGSSAAIALLEHRWAIPLRDRILEAGGMLLADEWIHMKDLIAVGIAAAEKSSA
jgi:uncharacterized membrane protein